MLVFVNPRLCPNRRFDLKAAGSDAEFVALDLKIPSLGNCLCFHCYRSPSFSPKLIFFNQLSPALEKPSTCTWFIVGDFNARHTQWDPGTTNTASTQMYKFLQDHALTQCITSPTRYSTDGTSSSVLDLFITNRPDLVDRHDISDSISDHCRISTILKTKPQDRAKTSFQILNYHAADWNGL